jgi:two-component system alkaline phosphatase synthesis response regulator PhoP
MNVKKKVLLVDDDADFVAINQAVLEKHGYAVAVAYNGRECLERVRADRPNLIVLDVMMATRSEGFDVSRDLRGSDDTKDIPLILVTSVNQAVPFKFQPDETWLPVDRMIEKPVGPQRLLEEVDRLLKK